MKHIHIIIFVFISIIANGQCKKDTSVQYYDSTNQSFSKNYNVTVSFGTGSEISNNYNYIGYDSDALYCVVYGFDEKHEVKLFTNYSSIYKTSCSSINSIFENGIVKGKDEDGRIWKIKKPSEQYYSDNNYSSRKYNKPQSSINHKYIASTLNKKQSKIDYNRERVVQKMDETVHQLKIIENEIERVGNPNELVSEISTVKKNINTCVDNADEYFASSNKSTLSVLSCLNRQLTNLNIIERNIASYSAYKNTNGDKSFVVGLTRKRNVEYCKISRIVNKDDKTIVEFEYISPYEKDGWININSDTYLYDVTNDQKLKLIGVWNTEISPKQKTVVFNEKTIFQLTFEKLRNDSKTINIIECERESCFNFYGVGIN